MFTGQITGKREENGKKLVDCKVQGVNQLGKTMGVAEATLVLSE